MAGSWNHRVVCRVPDSQEELGEVVFEIREVHYDEDGDIHGMTEHAITVVSEDLDGLRWTLTMMLEALDEPILDSELSEVLNAV